MIREPTAVDRHRELFRLPRVDELNKRQEDAMAMPIDGQHLVVGGPGTGKSVIALHRARMCAQKRLTNVFLVHNHLLDQAARRLVTTHNEDESRRRAAGAGAPPAPWLFMSRTWDSWFRKAFSDHTGHACPILDPRPGSGYQAIDWQAVPAMLENRDHMPDPPHLIIDEGQDMPPAFYQALVRMGHRNFFVVADQNQRIVAGENSSRRDIEISLGLATDQVVELDENFRNSRRVAELARHFYAGDPAVPPPTLPPEEESARKPLLYTYQEPRFQGIVRRILKMADRNVSRLIGILTPDDDARERYCNALRNTEVALDSGKPPIQTYSSGSDPRLRFDEGGIMVINTQSCKGLEFDAVFIADINRFHFDKADPDLARRRFYVMVARAREHVVLLRQAGVDCPVDAILPDDPNILERHGTQEEGDTRH